MWKYLCFQVWILERVNYSSIHIKRAVSYSSFLPDWDNTIKKSPEKILQKIQRSNKNWCVLHLNTLQKEKWVMMIWAIYESMSTYATSVKGCGTFPSYHSHGLCRGSKKPKKYHKFWKLRQSPWTCCVDMECDVDLTIYKCRENANMWGAVPLSSLVKTCEVCHNTSHSSTLPSWQFDCKSIGTLSNPYHNGTILCHKFVFLFFSYYLTMKVFFFLIIIYNCNHKILL